MSWKLPNELHETNVQKIEKANLREVRNDNDKESGGGRGREKRRVEKYFKKRKEQENRNWKRK